METAPFIPHLLIVDDEPSILEPLAEYFEANGMSVTTAQNTAQAREKLQAESIDIILLDVMMPGEDGLSLIRSLRTESQIPVILVTAQAEDTDRIVGLEVGADDYVTKPFNPRELLARVKAVLRRTEKTSAPVTEGAAYVFDAYRLVLESRRLVGGDGEDIPLTGGEFSLLAVLLERAGRVLSRDQLLDMTQGREAHSFDRSIDNQISRLRKKLEQDPRNPTIIKTVRGGGYVLAAKVTRG